MTGTAQRCGMAKKGKGIEALAFRRTPMTDKSNDPIAMWQKMVGEMEKGFNSFANQAMSSPEFSQAVNRAGGVAAGAQKQLGDLMEKYLVSMNLPSRDQVTGLAERLQSIEGQIGEIKSMLSQMAASSGISQGSDTALRPPRTKRPPSEGGEKT
ncbi:hypothetical protein ACVWXM_000735 [Bradyrhizobium sp. GM7.3]